MYEGRRWGWGEKKNYTNICSHSVDFWGSVNGESHSYPSAVRQELGAPIQEVGYQGRQGSKMAHWRWGWRKQNRLRKPRRQLDLGPSNSCMETAVMASAVASQDRNHR